MRQGEMTDRGGRGRLGLTREEQQSFTCNGERANGEKREGEEKEKRQRGDRLVLGTGGGEKERTYKRDSR